MYSIHHIHQRSASLFHLAEEDLRLGNLKFVSKDEFDEKVAAEKEGEKKTASGKQPKSKSATEKSSKPAPASKPKVTKEKPSKPSTAKPPKPKPAKEKSKRLHTHHEKAGKGKSGIRERQATGSSDMFCAVWAIREPVTEATRPLPVVEGDECEGRSKSRRRTAVKSDEVMMDQTLFFNDKSTEDEPGKLNVEAKVVSMVTAQIYQASSLVPPMSTPVIDLSPPKPAPSTTQAPVFTATISTTTTTRPLPPPPQQQSITDSELAARVVFNLELRDLPHKIDETVRKTIKEVVQVALQAPHRDRFRDLPEADMKKYFINGCLKLTVDPPPPPPDSDLSKKKQHDSDASGSSQPPTPQSSA
ncbi:hypothetical protein Tco_0448495 [Tanacetum coccineum]